MSLIVVFTNDGTGTINTGNYNGFVYINKKLIETFRIEGHNRKAGWEGLVDKLVQDIRKVEDNDPIHKE